MATVNSNSDVKKAEVSRIPLWIDNKEHSSDIIFPVQNAEKGVTVHEAYGATPYLAKLAVDSAQNAFLKWRYTKPWHRRELLLRAADYLQENRKQVADLIKVEVPMPDIFAEHVNVQNSIDLLKELAGAISVSTNGFLPHTREPNTLAMVVKEPYGVHLGIAPWNASLYLAMRSVLTPIACGNTAVLKASELSPGTHNFIARMLADAGFPAGVLNVIQHRREDAPQVVEVLIAHPAIKKVNFTGSTMVGKLIAGVAARYCKPTLMELGGKAPQVVLEDANLDEAAQAAVVGAFLHHGQICMSTDTVIAHESIVKQLTEKMAVIAKSWPMTSAVTEAGAAKTEILIQDALQRGSSILSSENDSKSDRCASLRQASAQLRPIMLADVNPDMRIYHEESFGPALTVLTFRTEEEAVRLANESIYGLSASIFSRNIPKAISIAREIESGSVHINSMTVHDEVQLPHGGMKSSGWGRFGVPWGFDEFLQLKTITITAEELRL